MSADVLYKNEHLYLHNLRYVDYFSTMEINIITYTLFL